MPKYYCDYCDTYLTHDSPSVRKTHCTGRKHKENVRDYYQKWMEEKAQRLIDQTTAAFKSGKIQPGMYPPIRPGFQIPPGLPIPQGIPILPPVLPPGIAPPISMIPGIPPPPRMIMPPPLVSSSQSTNLSSNSNVNSGILPGNPLLNSLMNPFIRPPSGLPPLISSAQNLPGVNSTTVQTTNTASGSNSSNTTIPSLMSISDSNPI